MTITGDIKTLAAALALAAAHGLEVEIHGSEEDLIPIRKDHPEVRTKVTQRADFILHPVLTPAERELKEKRDRQQAELEQHQAEARARDQTAIAATAQLFRDRRAALRAASFIKQKKGRP